MARSALAPRERRIDLRQILQEAVNPDADDHRKQSVDDILRGLKQLDAQREVCNIADEYYEGSVGMHWASLKVQAMLDRAGVEEIPDFRYARRVVKAFSDRLQISSVVAAPSDENEGDDETTEDVATERANKEIARLRKQNELDAEEKRLMNLVSRHGQAFLFVWPRPAEESRDGKDTADMRVNSAHNVAVVYDEEDSLQALYAIKSWETMVGGGDGGSDDEETRGKAVTRANLYYDDHIERWTTDAGGNPAKRDDWYRIAEVPDIDDEDMEDLAADEFSDPDAGEYGDSEGDGPTGLGADDIPNPLGRVPFFHFRNDRPEGEPEHASAYGPQLIINKLVYAHAGNIDYQSFPQRYLLMDPSIDDPTLNLSDPTHPDLDDEDIESEGGTSGLRSDPGELWKLWGKGVGEFGTVDPNNFLGPLATYVSSMADLTGLPRYALTRAASDLPSGEAAREMNADLNSAIGDRQDRYDPTLQDAYEAALGLLHITNVTVDVRWKPIQQVNDVAGWQVVQAKIGAGVPPKIALEEAGYASEQVDEWLKDAAGADLGRRVALLNQIGTAVQTIGAGIAMGAVSAEMAQKVVWSVLKMTLAGVEVDDTELELPDPEESEFTDPQAALKAQQDMHDKQLGQAADAQKAQLDHATGSQVAAHENTRQLAQEGHERAKEMFGASADREDARMGVKPAKKAQPPAGGRQGRGPSGRK